MPLVFALLPLELFEISSLTIQFRLIAIDLPLLIGLFDVLALELVANEGACSQSQYSTDRCAGPGVARRSADKSSGSSTAQSTDAGAFFARRETAAGAAHR